MVAEAEAEIWVEKAFGRLEVSGFFRFWDFEAVFAMGHVPGGGGVVVGEGGESAGHGFEQDIAEGFGLAGEEKQVGGSITGGELRAGAVSGEVNFRVFALEFAACRAIADDDADDIRAGSAHAIEGADGEFDVFFRRDPADDKGDGCIALGIP